MHQGAFTFVPVSGSATSHSGSAPHLVLYDGVCNLCNSSVQFILKHDPKGTFRFAALQGELATALLAGNDLPADRLDTLVYLRNGKLLTRSTAALNIAKGLRFPWPLLAVFLLIPAPLRDGVYRWVAGNRYRWFGKQEQCMVPTPAVRARFLDV